MTLQVPMPEPTIHPSSTLHVMSPCVLSPTNQSLSTSAIWPTLSAPICIAFALASTRTAVPRYLTHRTLTSGGMI